MVDIDQDILNNPDLGKASHLPYLDEITDQLNENLNAKREDRNPVEVPTKNENATGAISVIGFTTELQRRQDSSTARVETDKEVAGEDWNTAGRRTLTDEEKAEEDAKSDTEKAIGTSTLRVSSATKKTAAKKTSS